MVVGKLKSMSDDMGEPCVLVAVYEAASPHDSWAAEYLTYQGCVMARGLTMTLQDREGIRSVSRAVSFADNVGTLRSKRRWDNPACVNDDRVRIARTSDLAQIAGSSRVPMVSTTTIVFGSTAAYGVGQRVNNAGRRGSG